jgi:ligand-binding sensor domain-containing protein
LKKLTLVTLTIFMVVTSFSQEILQFTKYTIANSSLLSNNITSIEVMQNGSVWVSHDVGINVLTNGVWSSFNTFNSAIPNDIVNDIERVTDTNIWIATDEGIANYNGADWISYTSANTNNFPTGRILKLVEVSGNVYFVAEGAGLFKMSSSEISLVNNVNSTVAGSNILDLEEGTQNELLVLEPHSLSKLANSTWSSYNATASEGFNLNLQGVSVNQSNGDVLITAAAGKLIRYSADVFSVISVQGLGSNSVIQDAFYASTNSQYFLATNEGLLVGTISGNQFTTVNQFQPANSSIPSVFVSEIASNSSNAFWLASSGGIASFCNAITPVITSASTLLCGTVANTLLSANTIAGYTYSWRKNGAVISGAINTTYSATTNGTYSLNVTSPSGCNASSNFVAIQSNAPVSFVTQPPASQVVCVGTNASVTCSAVGCGLTYKWQELVNGVWTLLSNNTTFQGTGTNTLIVQNVVQNMNGRSFRCRITGTYAPTLLYSSACQLVVNTSPSISLTNLPGAVCFPNTVNITSATVVDANSSIGSISYLNAEGLVVNNPTAISTSGIYTIRKTTTCGLISNASLTVQINATPELSATEPQHICKPGSFDLSTLVITDATNTTGSVVMYSNQACTNAVAANNIFTSSAQLYALKITNDGCSDTLGVYIGIGTKVVQQAKNQIVCGNDVAHFNTVSRGIELSYQWQMSDASNGVYSNLSESTTFIGVNDDSLSVNVQNNLALEGKYFRCKVTTSCTGDAPVYSFPKNLHIKLFPQFTVQPSDLVVCAGGWEQFSVATTCEDFVNYQWQMQTNFSATSNLYNTGSIASNSGNYIGVRNDTLTVKAKSAFNGNQFRVVASSACGITNSNYATLYVNTSISGQSNNAIACTSDTAHFSVDAHGVGITYQWQILEGSVYVNLANNVIYNGVNTSDLSIVQPSTSLNNKYYRCKVLGSCNVLSSFSTPKKLIVWSNNGPLTVTSQPTNQQACENSTAVFACTGAANTTFRYQWQYFNVAQQKWLNLINDANYSGVKTANMQVLTNATTAGKDYRCVLLANCPPYAVSQVATLSQIQCMELANDNEGTIKSVYHSSEKSVWVQSLDGNAILQVEMYDLTGKKILSESKQSDSHKIDVSNFSEGIYLVKSKNFNGETKTERVIISN